MDETIDHFKRADQASQPPPRAFQRLQLHVLPEDRLVSVLSPSFVVGRHTSADLRLLVPDVSRQHCRLTYRDGGWRVADLDSLNGVFVNDARVLDAPLNHGDHIHLGPVTLVVKLSTVPDAQAEILKSIAEALPRKVA